MPMGSEQNDPTNLLGWEPWLQATGREGGAPFTIHALNQQGFPNSPSCNQSRLLDLWLIALRNSKAVSQDTAAVVEVIAHVASTVFERWHPK